MKNALEAVFVVGVAAAISGAISSVGRHESFGVTFLYVLVGVLICAVTMTATIMGFAALGRKRHPSGEFVGYLAAGWVIGLLVTTPLVLVLAFRLLWMALR